MLRLLAAAAILAFTTPAGAVPCRFSYPTPKVLTQPTTEIPSDGGVVIASWHDPDAAARGRSDDAAIQPTWRVRDGKKLVAPVIEPLAPGLAVYRLPRGTSELEDDKRAVVFSAKRTADAMDRVPAPKIKRVKYEVYKGRRSSSSVQVELAAAPPAGALALVIADAKKQVPRSWGVAAPGTIRVHSSGSCVLQPTGTRPTVGGERVVLFWVDAAGRRSEPSKVITVR